MTNLDIIKSTYEGVTSEQNGKNLQFHLAADASWTEAQGFPYAGTYFGFDAIKRHVFDRLVTEWSDYKVSIDGYVDNQDHVVAYGTYSGTYRATQQSFSARVAHLWTLKQGKIIRFEQFVDSASVWSAIK